GRSIFGRWKPLSRHLLPMSRPLPRRVCHCTEMACVRPTHAQGSWAPCASLVARRTSCSACLLLPRVAYSTNGLAP
ncbi:hypothetical protein HAX54_007573, partial [Datura stramonium]|nr:hypothetical protein [Datura stramonium]